MKIKEKCTLAHVWTDLNLGGHGNSIEGVDVGLDTRPAEEEFC